MSSLAIPLPGFEVAELDAERRRRQATCPHCAGIGVLTCTDCFCGAGGSSNGLERVRCWACGRSLIVVTQALNHWDLAVQAHNVNFPNADHDVSDITEIPVTRFVRTDIAWFSPGCGHHAYCRGAKSYDEEAVRSRATFNDIIRFTAHHRYDAVIVENVVEARLWCDTRGHRTKCNCGSHFNAWLKAMTALGYRARIVYFNSQFASVPQSRDRMYVVLSRNGVREMALDFQPASWCTGCEDVVHGVQTWKAPSRGGVRSRPGFYEWGRYGSQYTYNCPVCSQAVAPAVRPARTIIRWDIEAEPIGDRDKALAPNTIARIRRGFETVRRHRPMQVQVGGNLYERPGSGYARVWSIDAPLRAVTTKPCMGLVSPAGGQTAEAKDLGQPSHTIIGNDRLGVVLRYGGQSEAARRSGEPMSTITAHDRQIGLVVPGKSGSVPASDEEPVPTITGRPHLGMVVQNMTNNVGRDVDEPTGPVTTGGNHMLVALRRNTHAVDEGEPAQTVTAGGNHHGLLVYNGVPGFVRELDDAAGTVTTRDKQSLLVPYNRTGKARAVDLPTGTLTTHDREALVIPDEITDDFIDACLFRMLQWPELLAAQTMHERPDGSPYLLTARVRGKRGRVRDLSNEARVKMIGNAVSSNVATEIGWSVVEALAA